MNLGTILKMLGVKITPEQIAAIEAIIPQIPGHVQSAVTLINGACANFDQRLLALEKGQRRTEAALDQILGEIQDGRSDNSDSDTRPAGVGGTQRAIAGSD